MEAEAFAAEARAAGIVRTHGAGSQRKPDTVIGRELVDLITRSGKASTRKVGFAATSMPARVHTLYS